MRPTYKGQIPSPYLLLARCVAVQLPDDLPLHLHDGAGPCRGVVAVAVPRDAPGLDLRLHGLADGGVRVGAHGPPGAVRVAAVAAVLAPVSASATLCLTGALCWEDKRWMGGKGGEGEGCMQS